MAYFRHPDYKPNTAGPFHVKTNAPVPAGVDWRAKGAVTAIDDQLQCGSSPYWSAVVSMEGAWAIAGNPLTNLSAQQISDCSGSYGNMGCDGGEMTSSFQYVIAEGSEKTTSYPYTGNDDTCEYKAAQVYARFSSYKVIPAGDEAAFTEALAMVPVATAVNAQDSGFQFYTSGIYNSTTCNQSEACHGIGVVGYGTNSIGDYYILKNTWGPTWGMDGYMLLARNAGNMCQIASQGTYIIV